MILPEDEYKRENTDDTIVPTHLIPINEKNIIIHLIQIISLANLPTTYRLVLDKAFGF